VTSVRKTPTPPEKLGYFAPLDGRDLSDKDGHKEENGSVEEVRVEEVNSLLIMVLT
jgi:hypothetical protein